MKYVGLALIIFLHICCLTAFKLSISAENSWSPKGPNGGRISVISVAPNNHNVIFIGTIEDEIYKSTNGGQSWFGVSTGYNVSAIRDISINPLHPDTLYIGTIHGIFRSGDSGLNWIKLLPPDHENNEFRDITVNPSFPNIIFAGGPFDAWKSTDGGESWANMQLPGEYGYEELIVDIQNPEIVYLATESVMYAKAVYKSIDCGETWTNIHNNLDSAGVCRDICIDPLNDSIIYLARWDYNKSGDGKFLSKSTDGGQDWIDISPNGLLEWGAMDIEVSPLHRNEIWIASVMDGVFKSSDGGLTWQSKNNGLNTLELFSIYVDSLTGAIYLGTFYDGLYRSTDTGETWLKISYDILLSNCSSLAFNSLAPIKLAVQANNGFFSSTNGGDNWAAIELAGGILEEPSDIEIDKIDSAYWYASTFPRTPYAYDSGFYFSTNNGGNWVRADSNITDDSFISKIAISYGIFPMKRYFVAGYHCLYYSDNPAVGWQEITNVIPAYNNYSSMAVNQYNYNILAIGDYYNRVYTSTNRGLTWAQTTEINAPWPASIADIVFAPDEDSTIYVSSMPYAILKSTNLGISWQDISSNLPRFQGTYEYLECCGIAVNPLNSDNLIVSIISYGIFQTNNCGITWDSLNNGFNGRYPLGNLYFDEGDTANIYLSSNKGVWSIHRTLDGIDDDAEQLPSRLSLSSYPNPFNPSANISYTLPHAGQASLAIYNITGQKVATIFNSHQQAGEHSIIWNAASYPSGLYFAKLECGGSSRAIKMLLVR